MRADSTSRFLSLSSSTSDAILAALAAETLASSDKEVSALCSRDLSSDTEAFRSRMERSLSESCMRGEEKRMIFKVAKCPKLQG